MKNLVILGSDGSIGSQAVQVLRKHPGKYRIFGIASKNESPDLISQVKEFKPKKVVLAEKGKNPSKIKNSQVFYGEKFLEDLVSVREVDSVLIAIPGTTAMGATFRAIKEKKTILLATKEILVAAGDLINKSLKKNKLKLLPVDSEHSAIFQCLQGEDKKAVRRIILTCSGGPFRNKKKKDLKGVTKNQVLSHPVWKMGPKVTIDSATLMNKGFEVLEAHHLFNLPFEKIEVLVHPEGIIHSIVEFEDGSSKALLSRPDMRLPIQYALFYPERLKDPWQTFDLMNIEKMSFSKPDLKTFPCLDYAYQAGKIGGTMPGALNFADEIIVEKFIQNEIKFLDIPKMIEKILKSHKSILNPSLKDILAVKKWVEGELG